VTSLVANLKEPIRIADVPAMIQMCTSAMKQCKLYRMISDPQK